MAITGVVMLNKGEVSFGSLPLEEQLELLQAIKNGKRLQQLYGRGKGSLWATADSHTLDLRHVYRVKPDTVKVASLAILHVSVECPGCRQSIKSSSLGARVLECAVCGTRIEPIDGESIVKFEVRHE